MAILSNVMVKRPTGYSNSLDTSSELIENCKTEFKDFSQYICLLQLTTFQDLFVTLDLPYSVIRGEDICLRSFAFNYQDIPLQVASLSKINALFLSPERYGNATPLSFLLLLDANDPGSGRRHKQRCGGAITWEP